MATDVQAQPSRGGSRFAGIRTALGTLMGTRAGAISFIGVTLFVLVVFVGPIFLPYPKKINLEEVYLPPSLQHPLGTDIQGRDILALIVNGGRDVMLIALITGALTTAIAVTLGSLAAYIGGALDRVINGVANFVLTLPYLVLLAVLASIVRLDNPVFLALLLSALFWPSLMRTVRSQVLTLREREYVEAAVALDLGTPHIIFREILPNMASYIVINMIFVMTTAIYAQVGLVYLGLVPFSENNWGVMIAKARSQGALNTADTAFYLLAPVLTIALLQWLLVTLARSIEDVFNPRLKSGA